MRATTITPTPAYVRPVIHIKISRFTFLENCKSRDFFTHTNQKSREKKSRDFLFKTYYWDRHEVTLEGTVTYAYVKWDDERRARERARLPSFSSVI